MSGETSRPTTAPDGETPLLPAQSGAEASGVAAVPAKPNQPDVTAPSADATAGVGVKPPSAAAPVVHGEVLPPVPVGPYTPPANGLDLIYRMWLSMNWSRSAQIVVILLAAALLFAGLGWLAHAVLGTPTLWSTVLGGATGAGLTGGAAAYGRRRAVRHARRTQKDRE